MKRIGMALLAAAITGFCLWVLVTPQVLQALGRLRADAKPAPLIAAFVLAGLVQWLRAWRFAVMTSGRSTLPDAPMVLIALKLNFLNFVLPFRLGELGYPALMHQQYGHGLLRSAGVLLLARLFDLTTVVAILLGAAALLLSAPAAQTAALLALGVALAPFALVGLGAALLPRLKDKLAGASLASSLASRFGSRLGAGLARFARDPAPHADWVAGLRSIGRGPLRLVVGLGFAIWLTFGLAAVLVAAAVVDTVAPSAALLGAAAGNIAFALPVNGLAGLGPAQAAWVLATTWAGVPRADAIVSALALHAVVLGNALLFGALALGCGLGRGRALPGGQPSP
jgi:Lysylphosphatidylglycerol synthase TM region